ncbi:DUF1465 family protein [Novosphingobium olei]|uniref:DUF1465 family protein n=1 Tax=Novosphingobium olei TaxID=2728851 RepID=UPI0030896CEA|nr:DUF1465 family protein [Novosphingobium olei]
MAQTHSISPRIVEALYADALVLADAVRSRFERLRSDSAGARAGGHADEDDCARVLCNCEALRTTTRVMHCLAWLLNHRAYFAGEISEAQLRRHGVLAAHFPATDAAALALLPRDVQVLVRESERLYDRVTRIERSWRRPAGANEAGEISAIERLRQRLGAA